VNYKVIVVATLLHEYYHITKITLRPITDHFSLSNAI